MFQMCLRRKTHVSCFFYYQSSIRCHDQHLRHSLYRSFEINVKQKSTLLKRQLMLIEILLKGDGSIFGQALML